jgi:hypothetical protein
MQQGVLTGANRARGTSTGRAPGMDPIAAPIAVSSWITGVLDESLGSTVFAVDDDRKHRRRRVRLLQLPQSLPPRSSEFDTNHQTP